MLLDRIVIDAHGPLRRVELGPFTAHLNSVCSPAKSGKTAIARFIADSLIDREYPLGMFSSSSGRVVWADHNGLLHCRREADGTASGRRNLEFESRGDAHHRFDALESSWIGGAGTRLDSNVAFQPIELPESLADGLITDATQSSVARVVAACAINGLDSKQYSDQLPESVDALDREHHQLRKELRQVEAELSSLSRQYPDHDTLLARKKQLLARLAQPQPNQVTVNSNDHLRHAELRQQLTQLHDRARRLRTRQNDLRGWITSFGGKQNGVHPAQPGPTRLTGQRSTTLDDYVRQARSGRNAGEYVAELERVTAELDRCLSRAAELRRSMRSLQAVGNQWRESADPYGWIDREAMVAELRRIDECLEQTSRLQGLRTRRTKLRELLRDGVKREPNGSPLSRIASQWLRRLTANRLQQVSWLISTALDDDGHFLDRTAGRPTNVRIDDHNEADCVQADRSLAALAVRLAAGEMLAGVGRHIPLVMEIQPEMFRHAGSNAIAAALAVYARAGRQIIVLTSDQPLSSRLSDLGGREFQIHTKPISHAHRPLWKPHFQSEKYAGPHPHTYGELDEPSPVVGHLVESDPAESFPHSAPPVRTESPVRSESKINRDFDVAWREEYGFEDRMPPAAAQSVAPSTNNVINDPQWRDGFFYGSNFSTTADSIDRPVTQPASPTLVNRPAASPYLLSVDSPIDQAPSIDAVAAARLRGLEVTHIRHLMQADSCRLADALGMASVEAKTIRRWQAECRLVCRVPHLRGFDARILIACGVKTPAKLAAISPTRLLKKVEAFLATEDGQQLLLSGSSHELSRITSWIAAANCDRDQEGRTIDAAHRSSLRGRREIIETMRQRESANHRNRRTRVDQDDPQPVASRRRRRKRSAETKQRPKRDLVRYRPTAGHEQSKTQRPTSGRKQRDQQTTELRFNLQVQDDVVDAPEIGPRMAEKLNAIEIVTVNDLLSADPEVLAEELGQRRVDSETVSAWQQQATFVCRVPMLHGHDAQLLVAAGVSSPEELAECDAEELFELVNEIAESKEGRRIIRGGDPPDLAEVTAWIGYAQHHRELKAA